jgi:hypothetical protein
LGRRNVAGDRARRRCIGSGIASDHATGRRCKRTFAHVGCQHCQPPTPTKKLRSVQRAWIAASFSTDVNLAVAHRGLGGNIR